LKSFSEFLQELVPGFEIVKLADLTYKIANISKVRIGDEKKRTFIEYDEISLNDLDPLGVIQVPPQSKDLGSANATSIRSQALQENDIVLTHRGTLFKVGIVGNHYRRVIIGNNSMIRIQFHNKHKAKELALFVQAYLQLPIVKEYLGNQITCESKERRILSSAMLANLPIPNYKENETFSFLELYYRRAEMCYLAQNILQEAERIVKYTQELKNTSIFDAINRENSINEILCKDDAQLKVLEKILNEVREIE